MRRWRKPEKTKTLVPGTCCPPCSRVHPCPACLGLYKHTQTVVNEATGFSKKDVRRLLSFDETWGAVKRVTMDTAVDA